MLSFKESISPIRIIFFTSVIILAALSYYSYSTNLKLIQKANLVNHTNVVRFELQNAVSSLKDAETGSRAYLLTGEKNYLDVYQHSLKDLPVSFRILDSLLYDNPKQVKNMTRLRALADNKFSEIEKAMAAGPKAISPEILIESKIDIDEINAHVELMLYEEQLLLHDRTATLNEAVSFTPTINIWLAAFAVLLLIFSYFKIIRDLEKANALRKKITEANIVLEKSNSELAQFAYVASHDLQEPLRKIQTFISRITDTETALSPKGKDYFARVDGSAKRMQQLIRDILSYSRVDNRDNKFEHTDLNDVVKAATDQLEEFIKEKKAVINVPDLPSVHVVRYQFEQLFQNLLSNALKFSRPGVSCVINITASIIQGTLIDHPAANKSLRYHCIKVEDNGIGFDQQYGDRIFKIFHRLNTKEAYDGNGIGLSIVKKIAEAHNGFVSASGKLDSGAIFCIYIPV